MANFSEKVLKLTSQIPKGKVTTYQEIAHALGSKAYQAVGNALRSNAHPVIVPCHRVVKNDGSLGGYSGVMNNPKKKKLLEAEGVEIRNNKVIDMKKRMFSFSSRVS